jgi:hypothetical protein
MPNYFIVIVSLKYIHSLKSIPGHDWITATDPAGALGNVSAQAIPHHIAILLDPSCPVETEY